MEHPTPQQLKRRHIIAEIWAKRAGQTDTWAKQVPDYTSAMLDHFEQLTVSEVAEAWSDVRDELIHMATLCIGAIEKLDQESGAGLQTCAPEPTSANTISDSDQVEVLRAALYNVCTLAGAGAGRVTIAEYARETLDRLDAAIAASIQSIPSIPSIPPITPNLEDDFSGEPDYEGQGRR